MESAIRYAINELRPWGRDALERTVLYKLYHSTLDLPRGGGYWLWKPFIIKEALKEVNIGDIVIYADAGIEIIGDLSPLLNLALQKGILLFAGHYDDIGSPGPNICSKWTKRDCFVFMDSDEPRYYQSQMLDASFLVLVKTEKSVAFIREWFLYCSQPQLLTDQPNVCGCPNLSDFIEHRHDQSILSLLAARDGIELFRHPSKYGNHLKMEPYRQSGEWTRYLYGSRGIYYNSPYETLLNHHRGHLGKQNLPPVSIHRTISIPQHEVFYAWTKPEELKKWLGNGGYIPMKFEVDLQVGGKYCLKMRDARNEKLLVIEGEYIEVVPAKRLVYSWPGSTRISVEFSERGSSTEVILVHEGFSDERNRYRHLISWNAALDRLAETLSAP